MATQKGRTRKRVVRDGPRGVDAAPASLPHHGAAKAEAIRARLLALAEDGRLTVDAVIADARHPDSPLHDSFEWDVRRAAQEHWRNQARTLIGSIQVELTINKIVIQAPEWVRDPTAKPREQGYRRTLDIRDDTQVARESLLNECQRAAAYLNRVRSLAAAFDLERELDPLLDAFGAFRSRLASVA